MSDPVFDVTPDEKALCSWMSRALGLVFVGHSLHNREFFGDAV